MKLFLLKVLLQRRARDEGFTLPIVIALGLIMILLGAVNITTANEENLNAISDNQKNKALAIAEVGVARYRQLLDNNRMLTVYDRNDWTGVSNTCDINTSTPDYDPDVANINYFADTSQWHSVNDGTENIGQYRIVDYIYDIDGDLDDSSDTLPGNDDDGLFAPNDDNSNTTDLLTFNDIPFDPVTSPNGYNPRGVLTIQSQATDGSEAQVQVEIPIRINENDMTNLSPALWIGDRDVTAIGSLTIDEDRDGNPDGNIILSQPATGTTAGCTDPIDLSGNTTNSDPRPLPTIITEPALISKINNLDNIDPNISNDTDRYRQFRGEGNALEPMLLLGAKEATPNFHKIWKTDANGFDYYFYKTPHDLVINNGQKLATDGQSRVIVYVDDKEIKLNNNASLQAGSKFTSAYKSVGLQVYVNGDKNITINPDGGTVRIKGLIHAPQSTVNITSGGTVEIEGAMWVKNWNNTGNADVKIIPDNAGGGFDKAYQHYISTDNRAAKPITNAPIGWEIQEVD